MNSREREIKQLSQARRKYSPLVEHSRRASREGGRKRPEEDSQNRGHDTGTGIRLREVELIR